MIVTRNEQNFVIKVPSNGMDKEHAKIENNKKNKILIFIVHQTGATAAFGEVKSSFLENLNFWFAKKKKGTTPKAKW